MNNGSGDPNAQTVVVAPPVTELRANQTDTRGGVFRARIVCAFTRAHGTATDLAKDPLFRAVCTQR
jgi:hypothetical protein